MLLNEMMHSNIGIDIDDTITAAPEYFSKLTNLFKKTVKDKKIHIITSRTDNEEVREFTENQLKELGIAYDYLYILPDKPVNEPPQELDWYQQYLWQKVDYCLRNDIGVMFENEEIIKVLFSQYAPKIKFIQDFKD